MPQMPENLVPAKYIGNHAVELGAGLIYWNIDGTRRRSNTLEVGDTLMMRDEDIHGKTLLNNPNDGTQLSLGIGRVVLPGHAGLSNEELALLNYEFHMGRPDFEPLEPLASTPQPTQQTIASSVTINDSQANITEVVDAPPADENAQAAESENN